MSDVQTERMNTNPGLLRSGVASLAATAGMAIVGMVIAFGTSVALRVGQEEANASYIVFAFTLVVVIAMVFLTVSWYSSQVIRAEKELGRKRLVFRLVTPVVYTCALVIAAFGSWSVLFYP